MAAASSTTSSGAEMVRHWVCLITEQRRFPQMGYKSDSTVISGLDEGDMKAIDKHYKDIDLPCQLDTDDRRFVLKGTSFNPIDIINVLTEKRGYKVEYNPQQHGIPLKQGNVDDKFAMIYHLTKSKPRATKEASEPVPHPPARGDSLPQEMAKVNFKPAE